MARGLTGILIALVLAGALSGCSSTPDPPSTSPTPRSTAGSAVRAHTTPTTRSTLLGHTFVTRHYRMDGHVHGAIAGTQIRVSFEGGPQGDQANFDSGLNNTGGHFTINNGQLVVSQATTTLVGTTSAALGRQDNAIIDLVNHPIRATVRDGRLVLTGGGVELRLRRLS